ncbi:MAG: hypothetical protein QX189_17700, partial [Methylococcales bacterium]
RLDIFSKIVSSSFMEIFFQGGVFEDSIFPEFKISSLLFQKTVRTIVLKKGSFGLGEIGGFILALANLLLSSSK